MKNHERIPAPYALGTCHNGGVNIAGLNLGSAGNSVGPVVCIKTNGGALVKMPAINVTTADHPAENNDPPAAEENI